MSGGHGPESATAITHPRHPSWCEQTLCQRGHHSRQAWLHGKSHDTRLTLEDGPRGTQVSVGQWCQWDPRCPLHDDEGLLLWSLDEARKVHALLGELLAQVPRGQR